MPTVNQKNQLAADLHWLAFLLTERRELSLDLAVEAIADEDVASPYFSTWMQAWSRRVVIAKALTAIRDELADSARRTKARRPNRPALPHRGWTLDRDTSKVELERALLAIDVFPRAALLLSVFEGVSIEDAAVLLDSQPALVRKARSEALQELTSNLARTQGWASSPVKVRMVAPETQYA
jgi:DNA-directed RNA polymerase specialized sigma24 family protein